MIQNENTDYSKEEDTETDDSKAGSPKELLAVTNGSAHIKTGDDPEIKAGDIKKKRGAGAPKQKPILTKKRAKSISVDQIANMLIAQNTGTGIPCTILQQEQSNDITPKQELITTLEGEQTTDLKEELLTELVEEEKIEYEEEEAIEPEEEAIEPEEEAIEPEEEEEAIEPEEEAIEHEGEQPEEAIEDLTTKELPETETSNITETPKANDQEESSTKPKKRARRR